MGTKLTRRRFCTAVLFASSSFAFGANEPGRLKIPTGSPKAGGSVGQQRLEHGVIYVPPSYRPTEPLPLLVLLHKATGNCSEWFRAGPKGAHGPYASHADQDRFIILAPESLSQTWGSGGPKSFGYGYVSINRVLEAAFARYAIDRRRIAIGGFSDGASYALSLGLTNGDLFTNIIAFSPGYIVRAPGRGKPLLFIAHGIGDPLLPIAVTSRVFVPSLRKNGYNIDFREFNGGHNVPPDMAEQAMSWLARSFHQGG